MPEGRLSLYRHGRRHLFPPGVKRAGKNSFEAEIEKFNDAYLDRGIAGILCMGMDPGAVNVFARWAIDRLDTASSIRVLDADNAEVRGYRFAVLFSPETFFEELGATPYYVKNSRVVSGKPLETEIEWIRFPEPIGLQKTYAVAHEEGVSLGIYPPFVDDAGAAAGVRDGKGSSLLGLQIQPFREGS